MKNIRKISLLLVMILMNQTFCITARFGSGGGFSGGGRSGSRSKESGRDAERFESTDSSGASSHKAAIGGGLHGKNQQQQQQKAAVGLGAASMASQNNDDSDGSSNDGSDSGSTGSQGPPQMDGPMHQNEGNQNQGSTGYVGSDDVPTSISHQQGESYNQEDRNKDQQNQKSNEKKFQESLIARDKKTMAPDQDKILNRLRNINIQDEKIHYLLTQNSMDQLFNNFIYFKNFIVDNFDKDKMIHLATEFINQLYPNENIPTINMQPEKLKEHVEEKEIPQEHHEEQSTPKEHSEDHSSTSHHEENQSFSSED